MFIIANSIDVADIPSEIKILPVGAVKSDKGDFIVDRESFQMMKAEMQRRGIDIVIDYEHQTLKDSQAPAGGWIKELTYVPDAIIAKVEWTAKAIEYLKNKEYRYLSPVILCQKTDRKATMLHSVALTNTPAINGMFPIINSRNLDQKEGGAAAPQDNPTAKASTDLLSDICKLLGLPSGSDPTDILEKLKTLLAASDLSEKAMQEMKYNTYKSEVDGLIFEALKQGKITSSMTESAKQMAETNLQAFKDYIDRAPVIVPVGKLITDSNSRTVSNQSHKVCDLLGLTSEDLQKYNR